MQQRLQLHGHAGSVEAGAEARFDIAQVDDRILAGLAAVDLGLLHIVCQMVAKTVLQHRHQAPVQPRVGIVGSQFPRLVQRLGAVAPLDQVPGGQIEEHAAGHFAPARSEVAKTQQRHHGFQTEFVVEVGAGDMDAGRSQDVVRAVGARQRATRPYGPQPHHAEVGRAAADVGYQHQVFARDAAFVVEGRGDRLEHEADVAQARRLRGLEQHLLGESITPRIVVDKVHRPTQHHTLVLGAGMLLGPGFDLLQKRGDDVAKADGLPEHLGLFQQQFAAQ